MQQPSLLLNGGHSLSLSVFLPPSLSLLHTHTHLLSFSLFLFCFLSFLPGCSKIPLHYTISLCHRFIAFLSQKYKRLSDCPKVTGCIFLQPQGRGGFINQNSLGVNFIQKCLYKCQKNWRAVVFPL